MHNLTLHIDRIEDKTVIAFSDDGSKFSFFISDYKLSESDVVLATINDSGDVVDLKPIPSATNKTKTSLRKRLKSLFKK
ncbi:MAG: hypothetical protein E7598_06895 [Ruminococcaceae bacterium]|nr:hypothetical protein [Oscillospiraceae bacterium]